MGARTTVNLDPELVARARRYISARGLSQLLNELLAERVAQIERAALEAQLREGYLAVREERRAFNADWERIDGEGWDA